MNEVITIELTDYKADCFAPTHLLFFCNVGGYKCSKEAYELIKKSGFAEAYATKINETIIFVSYDEGIKYNLKECETILRTDKENIILRDTI